MRLLVFFDLPTFTPTNRRNYRKFRKFLIQNGFIMHQESVYSKLALNGTAIKILKMKVRLEAPPDGIVEMLSITESQYVNIEMVTGKENDRVINSVERLIII